MRNSRFYFVLLMIAFGGLSYVHASTPGLNTRIFITSSAGTAQDAAIRKVILQFSNTFLVYFIRNTYTETYCLEASNENSANDIATRIKNEFEGDISTVFGGYLDVHSSELSCPGHIIDPVANAM